ncbi:putative pheophorbide a oxygenase [Helianthus annuus]|nr:protochlorophyllide-dependent translocon component 52, chloroplastic [Helianthus annuus]KAJ0453033.1 putative pheophorbide a oxygenase [Helianthus annuus]KAJ0474950.1 putative pheophorbide a oxygenase [Helianthus annuus]KAJ0650505.1 putative pheophorbide a oxygenase [Helianthus annuus]KAJ0654257.1 putative pheophorbide a oxygenase [Helianthus annuus]KAJ0694983.1 putative pheophorbide a oxygenase [Helianthus annuus]
MKALSGSASFTVSSSPSITTTQFSNPIFTFPYSYRKPNSLSLSPSLIQFTKPKFTATVSTTETVEQDEKFDWFSRWYAIMPVCDLDKRAPHGKRVLGVDVVVWWDKNESAWKVFDDMCPHRLAPLSQGRIDQWGRLQCVYHGWCFSGSGECKLIPQASPDGPPVHTFQRACVAVYPSVVQNGIVWFWPSTDPQYKDIITKKKPPYIPELDDPSFTYKIFQRDIAYGYEVLIENLMDPAHVPYAHYGILRTPPPSVKVDREGGRPLDLDVQQIDKNGFTAIQPYGRSQFVAPCLYYGYYGSGITTSAGSSDNNTKGKVAQKPARRTLLIFICMPVSPGNSRVMMISPRNYNIWMDRLLPRWMFHTVQNLVIDSDLYLLHVEEKKIMEAGPSNWQKLCFVPTKSDANVVAFRKWLKIYAGGQIDWGNKFTGSLPPTPPREQLMDRYWSHVVNCSSCNAAYKGLNALAVSLQVFSFALVAIVGATKQAMISMAARNTLVIAAVLCFVGSKWLSHFIYKTFRYHGYNHAS